MRGGVFKLEVESRMLCGRRIAVLEMGAIGRKTAEIAKAYKMRVVGYARAGHVTRMSTSST
jgi:phosphoglycerate dehydrogenase-like enzyme